MRFLSSVSLHGFDGGLNGFHRFRRCFRLPHRFFHGTDVRIRAVADVLAQLPVKGFYAVFLRVSSPRLLITEAYTSLTSSPT